MSRSGRFIPGERSLVPIIQRLVGGPQSRSGSFGEEKSLLPCRDSNHWVSSPQLGHYTEYSATRMIIHNATEKILPNYLFILHVSLEFHFAFIKVKHSAGNQMICTFIVIISNNMLNKT